jgi:hypothetical protein
MTYIKLQGGLGNQLFQVAAAFAYSKKHKTELYLDASEWHGSQGKNAHEYKDTIFKNFIFDSIYPRSVFNYNEPRFNYDEITRPECNNPCMRLEGYFQSLKYFEDYKDEFLEMLWLPDLAYHPYPASVAVHIRQGDYLIHHHIHDICDEDYFRRALTYFPNVDDINIFTDAKEYSSRVFRPFQLDKVKIIQSDDELKDFTLLSRHDNIICSNSSFSWWASLIGRPKNKIIVPKLWIKNNQDHEDIYRKEFIRI